MENNQKTKSRELKSLDTLMGSNIQVSHFQGNPFFHTISGKANWEAKSKTYISPQATAFNYYKDIIYLARETNKGKSYGGMSFDELKEVVYQNHHLYEILTGGLKPYFDIEFEYTDKKETAHKVAQIWKIIRLAFENVGIKWKYKEGRDFYSDVIGIGEQGSFEGVKKYSSHLVINNGTYFKNCDEAKAFAMTIKQEIKNNRDEWPTLLEIKNNRDEYAIDFGVYTKNRLFKFPYQSKNNKGKISTRIQRPIKGTPNTLESFLVSNVSDDMVSIDVSKLVIENDAKPSPICNKNGVIITNRKVSASIRNFLEDFKMCLPDVCPIPEGTPDIHSLEYIIASIHNPPSLDHSVWVAVGMAIRRASGGAGFDMWVDWSSKGKQSSSRNISEMNRCWGGFSTARGYGFSTLLDMAKLCNPTLIKPRPYDILFHTAKTDITKYDVNKRYLDVEDFHLENRVSFINSPMGTGKSYTLHHIVADGDFKRIVYLSSKRAFAMDMGKEFEKDGFKNYIDLNIRDRYECPRIIISLESFHQINPDDIDLLIIDESESVLKIIGSKTLQQKGEGLNNLLIFEKAIRNSKKVLVMDAFLSSRSYDAITHIVGKCSVSQTINAWRPEKRTWVDVGGKEGLIDSIRKKLNDGKRCVLVSGSKNVAISIIHNLINDELITGELDSEGVYTGKDAKLYHSGSPLELTTNVNTEWSKCKILIYSPTITCGVSYTGDVPFDNLFVYAVNVSSACFRDTTQAIKRVRHFNNPEVCVVLNTNFNGHDIEKNPIYLSKIREMIYEHKPKIFTDEKHYISLNTTKEENYKPLRTWVANTIIYNQLEDNLSDRYLRDVATKYLELENIVPPSVLDGELEPIEESEWIKMPTFIEWNKIDNISVMEYNELIEKRRGEPLSIHEIFKIFKADFKQEVKENVKEETQEKMFNYYFEKPEKRTCWYNLIKMKKKLAIGLNTIFDSKGDASKVLEMNAFADERLAHAYKFLKHINFIKQHADKTEYMDFTGTFTKSQLEGLLPEYEKLRINGGLKAFNQLLQHKRSRSSAKDGEKANTMDVSKLYNMFKMLLKDTFDYTCEAGKRTFIYVEKPDGKKSKIGISNFMIGTLDKQFGNVIDLIRDKKEEKQPEPDSGFDDCDDI